MGYRWDANAQAYIFPSLAFKKVDGPMAEYQRNKTKSIQTDKAKQDRRKQGDERALSVQVEEPASLRGSGQAEGQRYTE
jgi:hypothetical protein